MMSINISPSNNSNNFWKRISLRRRVVSFGIIVIVISALAYFFYDHSETNQNSEIVLQNSGNVEFKIVALKSSNSPKKLGSVIMDLEGAEMSLEEAQLLQHPSTAGILLSKKNFKNKEQMKTLIKNIRLLRKNIVILADEDTGAKAFEAGCDFIILTKKKRNDLRVMLDKHKRSK